MSSGYWQTKRQSEQYSTGNTITQRIEDYIKRWEARCYSDGIPDALPDGVMKSKRAPCYKAIAIAILKNDHNMHSIGFSERESAVCEMLIDINRVAKDEPNADLFQVAH